MSDTLTWEMVEERPPHVGLGMGAVRQRVYRLSAEVFDTTHVLVSAATVFGTPETLVFRCTPDGKVTSWSEIAGGRGYLDHERALRSLADEVTR